MTVAVDLPLVNSIVVHREAVMVKMEQLFSCNTVKNTVQWLIMNTLRLMSPPVSQRLPVFLSQMMMMMMGSRRMPLSELPLLQLLLVH